MTRNFNRVAFAGVLCLTLAGAAAATAQDRQHGPAGANAGQRAAEHQKMFEAFRQRREMRLHDLLQIKPAQEAAFKAFLAAVEPKHQDGEHGPRGPGAEPPKLMTTPERLDRETARLGEMQQRIAATRTFYASLSPEQKKAFDELGPLAGHRHGMHGQHGFEGRGGWGHGGPEGPRGPGGPDGFQGPPPPR